MERLKQDYPSKDFCFVLGADLIDSLKTWDAPGVPDAGLRLWNECSFLVLDRPGYEIPENLPPNFIELTPLAGSTIVTEEVPSRTARAPTRTARPDRPAGDRPASDAEPDSKPRNPTPSPSLGPEPWPRAKRPRPRQVSSSEIRRRISPISPLYLPYISRSRPPRSGGASPSPSRSRTPSGCAAAVRATTSASLRSTRSSKPCRAAATSRWSTAKLTPTPRGLRRVRTGYAYQPPALGTYRTHRAACPQGPTHCTYGVRVPASGVRYVPRTVAPQVDGLLTPAVLAHIIRYRLYSASA